MIPRFRAFVKSGTKQVNGVAYGEDAMVPVGVLDITGGEVTVWGCGRENCGICDDYFRIKDIILMQSTGLYDKNGVEIFEGDIVRGFANNYTPIYQNGIYMAYNVDNVNAPHVSTQFNVIWRDGCEVIGNVHKNPEEEVEEE